VLKALVGKEPKIVRRADGRTGKVYCSVRFYTRAILKEFRSLFYAEGRKVVPEGIAEMLDPLALAVWFMDDGGRGAHTPKGLVINTSCFSVEEKSILQEALAKRFGIETSVHKVGEGWQLYVKARSFVRFCEIVGPYLLVEMKHKLPVDPVTTSQSEMVVADRRGQIYGHHKTSALVFETADEVKV
jgi:hypothetical protein